MKTIHKDSYEYYKDKKGGHRVRVYRQGRIVFASSEGYKRKQGALRNLKSNATFLANLLNL